MAGRGGGDVVRRRQLPLADVATDGHLQIQPRMGSTRALSLERCTPGLRCNSLAPMTATTRAEGGAAEAGGARTQARLSATGVGEQCSCGACRERAMKKRVKAWHWITRYSDLTTPPLPTLRWALLLVLGLSCWAAGIPLDIKDWLAPIIIAGALILPDVAGFGIAGFRLDLRQAQDEISALRQDVNAQARASSTALVAFGDTAIERAFHALAPATDKIISDQASGAGSRWEGIP
jgi:hypothetical protein